MDNPHFESVASWTAARAMLSFVPRELQHTGGLALQSLRVHVRDHKLRALPMAERTLEAHYGRFVFSQAQRGADEARRLALVVPYGRAPGEARIGGHPGRACELGPEPPPDDVDPRSPAVVTWHDGTMFYLIASDELSSDRLMAIAASLYA